MTARRGRWLIATAFAAGALGTGPAWGAAAGASASPGAGGGADRSAPPLAPTLKPEEEMLLEVRTDKWILDQAFSGYSTPRGSYLPLGAFARLLDLAINIDGDSGRGEGWYLDERNSFRIDVNAGFVETKDGRKPLKPGDAIATMGDIYVRDSILAQWFPVDAQVNLPKQQVELKLLAKFPFEAKMERETKREMIGFQHASLRIEYPREKTIYEMMSTPALDINMQASTGNHRETTSQFDVRASGDVAFMNADLFLAGTHDKPISDARFVLRRRDPDGRMFGPLGLTLIEIGDTSSLAQSLGMRSRTGRGVVVGNLPLDRGSVFDKIDMRGELPIGYEVELYRNDVLIGSVHQGVNGRYEFTQVPLEFGLNVLRLVFYGPHGERREEVRQINAGEDRLSKGEFQFAASAIQQDENLIPIHRQDDLSSMLDKGAIRAAASAQYGLSSRITGVAGVASFVTEGNRINQGSAGIRTSLRGAAVQVDAAVQGRGAWALQTGVAGRLFGASYVLQHSEYGGAFIDELRGGRPGAYVRDTQLRVDRGFRLGERMIATNLLAERAEHGGGATELSATFRASTSFSRWLVSNQLQYRRATSGGTSSQSVEGNFEVNGLVGEWGVRGGIGYDLRAGAKFRQLDFAVDHDLGSGTLLRGTLSKQLTQGSATRIGLSLSRRIAAFDVGGDVQYDTSTRSFILGIRTSFSFGRGLRGWHLSPPGLARGGSLVAIAFRDLNGDGRRESNEPVLPGVGFRGGAGEVKTNASGQALITGLGDGRPAQVAMLSETLPDPYLTAVRPGVEVVPRPGRTHVAWFAVATVSEVEGHAFFQSASGNRAVSNVQLQLLDSAGKVVASGKTEYDGYFFLEKVPPGDYKLQLDPEQMTKLGIRLAAPVHVKAGADGGLVGDIVVNVVRGAVGSSDTIAAN